MRLFDQENKVLKNYRPVSLLPFCTKVFERSFITKCSPFFTENNLIFPNQSGFIPWNSCVNHLLAITHEISQSVDNDFEVRGVLWDISKAFHKIWRKGMLFKLNRNGISRNLILLYIFLFWNLSRKQLLTISKLLVRSHVGYADIIYDKPFNDFFKKILKTSIRSSTYYYGSNKRHF